MPEVINTIVYLPIITLESFCSSKPDSALNPSGSIALGKVFNIF